MIEFASRSDRFSPPLIGGAQGPAALSQPRTNQFPLRREKGENNANLYLRLGPLLDSIAKSGAPSSDVDMKEA